MREVFMPGTTSPVGRIMLAVASPSSKSLAVVWRIERVAPARAAVEVRRRAAPTRLDRIIQAKILAHDTDFRLGGPMNRAREIIAKLGLAPHPERGYYTETYRAALSVGTPGGARAASTAIYFLLA